MIREEQIPKDAEEAGQIAVIAALHLIEPDARVGELTMDECAEIARAAIAAALASWPGVDYRPGAKVTKTWRDPGKIILSLTQENENG